MVAKSCVRQEAIFIGANKQSFVADYCPQEQLVAYGASNTVALWNPLAKDKKGVFGTLKKHSKEITGVKFIPNSPFMVSVAEDFEVNIWKKEGNGYGLDSSLEFHTQSITCLTVFNEDMFATGSADGFIALWGFKNETKAWGLIHSFQVKSNFYPMTLALQEIDGNGNYVFAVGGTTSNIYIYSFMLSQDHAQVSNFEQSAVLTGHEDWVKCLNFVIDKKYKSYVLASGSQDRYIRLWRLKLNDYIDDSDEDERKLVLLSNKQYKFNIGASSRAAFSFEALIMGHDDWVTGLQWHPSYTQDDLGEKKLQLLSSSADTALMIWEMDADSGIWCCVNRLGEMSIKGASTATGASGGFWSCLWFSDKQNQYILANGKTGSFRVYKTVDEDFKSWESTLGVTGAVREVTDLTWSRNGEYVSSTSLDQTTRLFAPWVNNRDYKTWHEFARPQIHGYDMICLDNITSTKYVSGGDEKLLRVFEMTHSISKLLKKFCGIDIALDDKEELPESASLPVLGLSNKAANEQLEAGEMAQQQQDIEENGETNAAKEDILDGLVLPPLEDHLQRYTLFPEIEKLYGHGYEITCCATSPSGSLIASACRSNNAKHSVIRVFNVGEDFQQCQQVLQGHNLTITSLEFSPDGKYLMSVSRDRQFTLWKVVYERKGDFELVEINTKAHSRIIWDCSWAPTNSFGNFVLTGSRDKQIKLWQVTSKVEDVASLKLQDAVTSVSCYNTDLFGNNLVVSVGLENGDISLFSVDLSEQTKVFKQHLQFDPAITPSSRVAKLSFSSILHDNGKNLMLGVASNDTSVRVYSINVDLFS